MYGLFQFSYLHFHDRAVCTDIEDSTNLEAGEMHLIVVFNIVHDFM